MKNSRFLPVLIMGFLFSVSLAWETDLDTAKEKAKEQHKHILLNFSGSDWCGPCIRMHKEIFEAADFKVFADSSLILVNADFPRLKKNQLSKDQQKKNDKLADKYNPQGSFPLTILLNEEGKVLRTWEGYPDISAVEFTGQIKAAINAR